MQLKCPNARKRCWKCRFSWDLAAFWSAWNYLRNWIVFEINFFACKGPPFFTFKLYHTKCAVFKDKSFPVDLKSLLIWKRLKFVYFAFEKSDNDTIAYIRFPELIVLAVSRVDPLRSRWLLPVSMYEHNKPSKDRKKNHRKCQNKSGSFQSWPF